MDHWGNCWTAKTQLFVINSEEKLTNLYDKVTHFYLLTKQTQRLPDILGQFYANMEALRQFVTFFSTDVRKIRIL